MPRSSTCPSPGSGKGLSTIAKSSGSDRLDSAACDYVKAHWKWQPPTSEGKPVVATTLVQVIWNLKDAQ